jgi:hypothetical protein
LSSANFSYANLSSADLRYANLRYAVGGSGERIQCLQIHPYKIVILDKEIVWGGCTKKTVQEWLDYAGDDLSPECKEYLERITKPLIRMVCGDKAQGVQHD